MASWGQERNEMRNPIFHILARRKEMICKYWRAAHNTSAFVCLHRACAYHWRIPWHFVCVCVCVFVCTLRQLESNIHKKEEREIRFSSDTCIVIIHFCCRRHCRIILRFYSTSNVVAVNVLFVCVRGFLHNSIWDGGMFNSIPYAWNHLKNPAELRHTTTLFVHLRSRRVCVVV